MVVYAWSVVEILPIVQQLYHARTVNVSIHAYQDNRPVELTLCVEYQITEPFAFALMVTKANLVKNAISLNVITMMIARQINSAANLAFVRIHACNMEFVVLMHNAELLIVKLNALVHRDTLVIQKLTVRKVCFFFHSNLLYTRKMLFWSLNLTVKVFFFFFILNSRWRRLFEKTLRCERQMPREYEWL